jgi:nucleoside transporter
VHSHLRLRLGLQMFLAGAVNGAWQPVLPPYLKGLGFSESQIDLTLATMPLATMISPIFVGHAADRWIASERLLSIINLGSAILMFAARGTSSFLPFTLLFSLSMLMTVPVLPLTTSVALQNLPDGARDFPAIRACGTFGHVTGANLVSGWLWVTHRGYADSLAVAGALALLAVFYSMTLPSTPPRRDSRGRAGGVAAAAGMFRDPGFAFLIALLFLVQMFGTSYYARGPLFLLASGVSREGLSSLMSIGQLTEIVVVLLLPVLYGRLGAKGTLAIGIGAWALRYALWAQGNVFALVVLAIALHGVCFACARIASTIYVDRVCPRNARASAQSLLSLSVDGSGAVMGNLLIGQLVVRCTSGGVTHWRWVWLVHAVGLSAVLVTFLAGFRERREAPGPLPLAVGDDAPPLSATQSGPHEPPGSGPGG